MGELSFFLVQLWLWHFVIAGVPCLLLVFFGRKRARWQMWEALAFVVPFVLWATLMVANGKGKTLGNAAEVAAISFAIVVAALIRVAVGHKERQPFYPAALLLLLCVVSAGLYFFVPGLPE